MLIAYQRLRNILKNCMGMTKEANMKTKTLFEKSMNIT